MNRPKGYRFCPTDSELVNYYLKMVVLGYLSDIVDEITEVDINEHEPWELPGLAAIGSEDRFWYFFYKLRRYRNSSLVVRTTNNGYWKITGKNRHAYCRESGKVIGIKKTLTFYNGRSPNGVKTDWVKQEYHATAPDFPANQEDYVVCCLKKKPEGNVNNSSPNEGESSHRDYGDTSGENAPTVEDPLSIQNLVNSGWASPTGFQNQMYMQQQSYNNNGMGYYNDYNNQEDQQFWDSLIVDPEESSQIYRNMSSPQKPLHMVCVDNGNASGIKTFPIQCGQVLGASTLFNDSPSNKTRDLSVNSSTDKPYKINGGVNPGQKSEYRRKYHKVSAKTAERKQNSKTGPIKDIKKYMKTDKTETKVIYRPNSNRTAGRIDHKELSVSLKISETGNISSIYLFNAIVGILLLILVLRD